MRTQLEVIDYKKKSLDQIFEYLEGDAFKSQIDAAANPTMIANVWMTNNAVAELLRRVQEDVFTGDIVLRRLNELAKIDPHGEVHPQEAAALTYWMVMGVCPDKRGPLFADQIISTARNLWWADIFTHEYKR